MIHLWTAVLGRGNTTQLLPLMSMVPPGPRYPCLLQVHCSTVATPVLQLAPFMKGTGLSLRLNLRSIQQLQLCLSHLFWSSISLHFRRVAFICSNITARTTKLMHFRDSRSAQEDHQGQHHVPKTLRPCHHLAHGCQTPLSAERVKQGNSSSHGCC